MEYCEELVSLAEGGNVDAEFRLGVFYWDEDHGVLQDYAKCAKWMKRAAEHGHGQAASVLFTLYGEGKGVPLSIPTAIKWLKRSTELGYPDGQLILATLYLDETGSSGVPYDRDLAIKWMREAADNGDPTAQEFLKQKRIGITSKYK